MNKLMQTLQSINWDFSDYNSLKYPLDINSIPWYPATFISPIPKFLIALLTKPGDTVLDPFGGKGTTAVEAIKQGRYPIYNDLNPFASEITKGIFDAIQYCIEDLTILNEEDIKMGRYNVSTDLIETFILENNINKDVIYWYDLNTLSELCTIVNLMKNDQQEDLKLFYIRKLAVSSILKSASSQPGHFTYVTDNCRPTKLIYKDAKKLYLDRLEQIILAAKDLIKQFSLTNPEDNLNDILKKATLNNGDARKLDWIDNESVNLVLTSPPYLCAQDYIKTMRLTNLFFPDEEGFNEMPKHEIGSRSKRRSKADIVVPNFYSDMNMVFSEIQRVLVPGGYFCLIIGQGKARITKEYDTITDICNDINRIHGMNDIYHASRKISSRVIQVGGVEKEDIIIFQKKY